MTVRTFEPFSRPRTFLLASLLTAALVAGALMIRRVPAGVPVVARPVSGAKLFEQVREHLAGLYVDTLSDGQLYRMAINGLIGELGDPYSVFLPPDRLSRLTERTSGTYAGIGLQVDMRDGFVVVVNPLVGGPGERAGILTGDRIIEVDGKAVNGWTSDEVQRLLRGAPGSLVAVTVQRAGTEGLVETHIIRQAIHQSAVRRATVLPGRVGYIELRIFSDSTEQELRRAVNSVVKAGAQSLIIDVRSNPGGLLEQGVRVADLFLDAGKRIVSTRGRVPDANQVYTDSASQVWPTLALAVLVDDKTASAAELLAGALQDHDRAVIVGMQTYGKGSAQNVYPLEKAGALKLTTARWFTPVGRSIAHVTRVQDDGQARDTAEKRPKYKTDAGRTVLGGGGITPDIVNGDTTTAAADVAFIHALGNKVSAFRDALASFALHAKTVHSIASSDFVVTQEILDDVYARMVQRGVTVPRSTYNDVAPLVSRLLSYEVARYVFGADAEFQRKAMDDKSLIVAQQLLAGATSQRDVLDRAKQASASVNSGRKPSG